MLYCESVIFCFALMETRTRCRSGEDGEKFLLFTILIESTFGTSLVMRLGGIWFLERRFELQGNFSDMVLREIFYFNTKWIRFWEWVSFKRWHRCKRNRRSCLIFLIGVQWRSRNHWVNSDAIWCERRMSLSWLLNSLGEFSLRLRMRKSRYIISLLVWNFWKRESRLMTVENGNHSKLRMWCNAGQWAGKAKRDMSTSHLLLPFKKLCIEYPYLLLSWSL